jgi:isopenicillin N synthase-like dioxygenase
VYQRYCEEMKALSLTIMELLELSLGVERGYYREFFEDSRSIMRCNYYPPCPEPERTLGTGPHCDPTALTILLQDDVGGLEVLVDGEWRPVRPVPGAMVINIGDTFMVRAPPPLIFRVLLTKALASSPLFLVLLCSPSPADGASRAGHTTHT